MGRLIEWGTGTSLREKPAPYQRTSKPQTQKNPLYSGFFKYKAVISDYSASTWIVTSTLTSLCTCTAIS